MADEKDEPIAVLTAPWFVRSVDLADESIRGLPSWTAESSPRSRRHQLGPAYERMDRGHMSEREKSHRLGRRLGLIVVAMWELLSVGLGVRAVVSGWALGAAAWFVLAFFFLVVTILSFVGRDRPARRAHRISSRPKLGQNEGPDFVELLRSTNLAELEAVRTRLRAAGMEVSVRGEHSSTALGMLPGMAIQLFVRQRDLEECIGLLSAD